MKKNLSDEKLIELLRSLPREKAPENFEFNLMTRIKNKNFGELQKESSGNLMWILIPSASIVTAAVVVLMIMFSSVQENIPLNVKPPAIVSKKTETFVVINSKSKLKKGKLEAIKIVKAKTDAVSKQKIIIPINKEEELSVDKFLNKPLNGTSSSATLVSSEERLPFEFHEFLPYSSVSKKTKSNIRDSVISKTSR